MKNKKFDKLLTIILIIISIAIFIIIGFWGYNMVKEAVVNAESKQAVNEFDQLIEQAKNNDENNLESSQDNLDYAEGDGSSEEWSDEYYGSSQPVSYTYKGFNVVGKINIPRLDLEYPVYDVATISSMENSVGIISGPGLNQIGNTVIMGHNYRNGTFFSNNDQLEKGDVIYITDAYGRTMEYEIYLVYTTTTSDFDYAIRDTNGIREITLASCTDDSKARLIIWAKEN